MWHYLVKHFITQAYLILGVYIRGTGVYDGIYFTGYVLNVFMWSCKSNIYLNVIIGIPAVGCL